MSARSWLMAETGRLRLQHGPIDLVAGAWGNPQAVRHAYRRAVARFEYVLDELVGDLPVLRQPIPPSRPKMRGSIAGRMVAATWPHRRQFVTPMAAVAGAVADDILAHLRAEGGLVRAYVNNGGDIAFYLAAGESLTAGVMDDIGAPALDARVFLDSTMSVRGLATSGWRGRSLSMGIADAVTALADSAAAADVAATLIANAIDGVHPSIQRAPANSIDADSDLGARLVTRVVGPLPRDFVSKALRAGQQVAQRMIAGGLIVGAYMALQGQRRVASAAIAGYRRQIVAVS